MHNPSAKILSRLPPIVHLKNSVRYLSCPRPNSPYGVLVLFKSEATEWQGYAYLNVCHAHHMLVLNACFWWWHKGHLWKHCHAIPSPITFRCSKLDWTQTSQEGSQWPSLWRNAWNFDLSSLSICPAYVLWCVFELKKDSYNLSKVFLIQAFNIINEDRTARVFFSPLLA